MTKDIEAKITSFFAALEVAETAYQSARPQIGSASHTARPEDWPDDHEDRDSVARRVIHCSIDAYMMMADLAGFASRMRKGQTPNAGDLRPDGSEPFDWFGYFDGAYRFYREADFDEVYARMEADWPLVSAFTREVREAEARFGEVVEAFR
ncbi:hypothetical protein [Brevundimonas sp. M20]|uniref:hypothetical protein n=1 Tax=Brevundimonas sp. M20 TaxID=2591463 RepID=UPI001146EA57|nr:hypothetical protein [Brevundimonas sp. M20]QDH73668.1 hypothetical protein FKQ52_09650 [Brevundimonas sp. M20]